MQFRKKPIVIEAQQFGTNDAPSMHAIAEWVCGNGGFAKYDATNIFIETLEGTMRADVGDWVIKGVKGEFYPCKPDIFAATYDTAGSNAGLPVAGYQPQSDAKVEAVNGNKRIEETLLRVCDAMKDDQNVDQRWLAVARTGFEQAFMAMNRSIFRPGRVKLPGDPA